MGIFDRGMKCIRAVHIGFKLESINGRSIVAAAAEYSAEFQASELKVCTVCREDLAADPPMVQSICLGPCN